MTAVASSPVIKLVVDSSSIPGAVNRANAALSRIGQGSGAAGAQTTIQRLTMSLGGAGSAASRAAANSNVANSAFGSLGASAQAAMGKLTGMGGSLAGIGFAGATIGATALVGALTALGTAAVGAAAHAEAQKASLATVTGSVKEAQETYAALVNFAAKTPFDVNQAVDGYIKLRALGLQPTERAMMSYGNTASAMGKQLNQMIEAVADAGTGEFERLKEFGITAKTEGDKVRFTFGGVATEVKKNSAEIQKYLIELGESKFGDAMSRQMLTFNGALSNLSDAWDQTLVMIGEGGLLNAVGGAVKLITDGINSIGPVLGGIGNMLAGAISGITSLVSGVGNLFSAINTGGASGVTLMERITFQFNMIGQIAQVIGTVVGGVFSAIGTGISEASSLLTGAFGGALDYMGIKFDQGGRSWTNSLFGILRAGKAVAMALPDIFKIAITDLMSAFSTLGQAIGALLTGQWDKAKELASKPLMTNTGRAINAAGRIAVSTYKDESAADAAMNRMLGRKPKVDAKLSQGLTPPPPPGDKDKDKDAAAKAKRENDFWQTLKDQLVTAGMLTLQAETYNKQLELRKILERDLTATEQARVATALSEINTAKAITSLRQRAFEAANEYTVESGRALGLTEAQRAVENELYKYRLDALNRGVDINAGAYKTAEADLRTQLDKNAALKEQNALLAKAGDFARKYSSAFDIGSQLRDMDKEREAFVKAWNANGGVIDGETVSKNLFDAILSGFDQARAELKGKPLIDALNTAANGSVTARSALDAANATTDFNKQKAALSGAGLSPEATARALKEITANYKDRMLQANRLVADDFIDTLVAGIDDIGRLFGGMIGELADKLGDVISSIQSNANGSSGTAKLMTLISGKLGEGFKESSSSMLDIGKGFKNLGDPLKDLKASFGKGGDAIKGIGSAIGGAMAGAQMGSMIGDFGKMLGANKGFQTGSKIGGTIGGLTGNPIIAAGTSLIGGLIGSLFSKAKKGSAVLTGAGPASITGNKASVRDGLSGSASSIQDALSQIADQIGGEVGAFRVSIGKYKDSFRVSASGAENVGTKKTSKISGLIYDGKDEAAAIAAAIKDAIADGAIVGISDFAQKALKALDVDKAVSVVNAFKTITDELGAMRDPIGAAVRSINAPLDSLIKQMQAVGASSTDLAKVEEYRSLSLANALKEQLSSINDFKKSLMGEGSGVSALDRLNSDLAEFKGYQDRIAAGESVDQSAFTALGQSIFSAAKDVYGTSTGAFQDIRNMLIGTSDQFAQNITTSFGAAGGNAAVEAAIAAQTSAVVSQAVITNNLLGQLVQQNAANNNTPVSSPGLAAKNGQLIDRAALY